MTRMWKFAVTLCALIVAMGLFDAKSPHSRANAEAKGYYPDLVIGQLMPGASYEDVMSVYVYNQGKATAGPSTLGVRWSLGRLNRSGDFAIPSLQPGKGQWVKLALYGVNLYAPGAHVRYIADVYNAVYESDETNNEVDCNY